MQRHPTGLCMHSYLSAGVAGSAMDKVRAIDCKIVALRPWRGRQSVYNAGMDKKDIKETEDLSFRQDELPEDKSLVIVDDDKAFLQRLGRAMELRGFEVRMGSSIAEGLDLIRQKPPAFAVVDMRLEDGNGLDVIAELAKLKPNARAIVLTGYGNFATAVSAVKLGAADYLAKPADADEVTDALLAPANERAAPPENPMSADRVRWEHIQRVYELCNRNVSETARRLNMHRRTLQRILAKRAPK